MTFDGPAPRRTREGDPQEGAGEGAEQPRLRGPWWFGERRRLTEEQRGHLLSQLYFEGPDRQAFLTRFATLLALSVLIAVFGLAEDSGPVVIGAMLVSPLTTPLLGLAGSLVMGWPRRQLESVAILVAGTIGAIALAWVTLWLIPEPETVTRGSAELLARTEPRLLDLGIAIVAGAAGAYVLVRREAIGALPGVAIAVALVPPLSTVGMMLELGEPGLAGEALLLYLTNLVGIVVAAAVVLLVAGMRPETVDRQPRRVRVGLGLAVAAALAIAYPLARVTADRVTEAEDQDDATRTAREWAAGTGLVIGGVQVEEDSVHIDLAGPNPPPSIKPLAASLAREFEQSVDLSVAWTRQHLLRTSGSP